MVFFEALGDMRINENGQYCDSVKYLLLKRLALDCLMELVKCNPVKANEIMSQIEENKL